LSKGGITKGAGHKLPAKHLENVDVHDDDDEEEEEEEDLPL